MFLHFISLFLLINALFDGIILDRIFFHIWFLYRYYWCRHSIEDIVSDNIENGTLYGTKYLIERYNAQPYDYSIEIAIERNKIDVLIYLMSKCNLKIQWPDLKETWSVETKKLYFWKDLEHESRP